MFCFFLVKSNVTLLFATMAMSAPRPHKTLPLQEKAAAAWQFHYYLHKMISWP